MNAPNLRKICCFFYIERWGQITFYNLYNTQKKNYPKVYHHKLTTKITTFNILQIDQIIFFLSHVTIFRNFVLSQATV